jgi:hypothetical protein
MVLIGVGMGLALAPATTEAMRGIPPERAGTASGVLNTARQTGAALGAAVVGAVLQNRLVAALREETAALSTRLPEQVRPRFLDAFEEAAAHGLRLGAGQQGGVETPADLPPDQAELFGALAREAFGAAFVSASRPALAVAAGAILFGGLLALGLKTRAATPAPVAPVRR